MDLERLFVDALGLFMIVLGVLFLRGGRAFEADDYWLPSRLRGRPARIARACMFLAFGVLFILVPRIAVE